jgi:hypothetical protein
MAEFMLMLIAESMEELMDFEIKHIFNYIHHCFGDPR